jgi:hypothetical protein
MIIIREMAMLGLTHPAGSSKVETSFRQAFGPGEAFFPGTRRTGRSLPLLLHRGLEHRLG